MIINPYVYVSAYDPDAQAFITAAGITDATQKSAVNQLVLDLKSALIWTKMKAIYPIVGGTASTHKWNLKDPLDTDAAFRLTFSTGWTHASTGMTPNVAYADTFLNMSTNYSVNDSLHISFYSRTSAGLNSNYEMGVFNGSNIIGNIARRSNNIAYFAANSTTYITASDTNGAAFYLSNRLNTTMNGWRNSTKVASNISTATTRPNLKMFIGTLNDNGTPNSGLYTNKQFAFASIGDGLTDTESSLLYQITEKYQVALGRNINTTQNFYYNGSYDNDTNVYLFRTQITDTTQQTAVNTLVTDLKSYNIWTKMKAVYPVLGGTAATHAINLTGNTSYNLSFSTGWTHSSTGMLPNGTSAYADTFYIPSVNGILNSSHISYYSRTNQAFSGQTISANNALGSAGGTSMYIRTSTGYFYGNVDVYPNLLSDYASALNNDSRGFFITSRTASNSQKGYKNSAILGSSTSTGNRTNRSLYLAATNKDNPNQITEYGLFQCSFASIGDGLTDAEAANFYTAVQNYNTTLGRQV